ncbi:hypothetical protein COC47_28145 [Bacillus cereus]|uniref:hypothetical protein n=1 Tax=Bacillus cereus TaxID=1396 RepID=UPI000BFCCF48|nr:hypothetical protein [Bacillus cereus]PGR32981.1 hypothetical protein COC47_28145 [Bacillus cereus]
MDAAALFGFLGALLGGGVTYLGTVKTLQEQQKQLQEQQKQQKQAAIDVIDTFVMDELIYNKKIAESNSLKLSEVVAFSYKEMINQNIFNMGYKFKYKEYENIKYDLVKLSGVQASITVHYYKMFEMIQNNALNDLSESEFNFIKMKYEGLNKKIEEYNQNFETQYKKPIN